MTDSSKSRDRSEKDRNSGMEQDRSSQKNSKNERGSQGTKKPAGKNW